MSKKKIELVIADLRAGDNRSRRPDAAAKKRIENKYFDLVGENIFWDPEILIYCLKFCSVFWLPSTITFCYILSLQFFFLINSLSFPWIFFSMVPIIFKVVTS